MPFPPPTPMRRAHGGFTLIELLVTVTLLAVLLGIGVPSFRDFIANQKVKTAAFDLATAMLLARSEAIKRNASITLEQETGGWANGWSVKSGATVLLKQEAQATVSIVEEASGASTVTYLPTGRISSGLRFEITGVGTAVRCVSVDASGITSTKSTTC